MLGANQSISLKKDSYTLVNLIGEGGQGVIWQVIAASTGKSCVLKTIRTHEISASGRPQRFETIVLNELSRRMQEEINFLLRVKSKQNCFIANCLDHGVIQHDGINLPAMIMPHYPKNLRQQIPCNTTQHPEYNLSMVLSWLIQLSQALQCTHEQLVDGRAYMHRDIKPPNILLTENNEIRLIDFGISKQQSDDTGTTSIAHSPAWAAPEQILPESLRKDGKNIFRLTGKTDIYSLGLIAYHLFTGGAEPSLQTDFRERSQAIYTEHIIALSNKQKGQLENFKGLSNADKKYLRHRLLSLFFDKNTKQKPIVKLKSLSALPLPHIISEQIIALLDKLLRAKADDRPTAVKVKQQFNYLHQSLSPQLESMSVAINTSNLLVGEALDINVQLNGKGLVTPFDWLHIYDQKQQLHPLHLVAITPETSTFLAEKSHIHFRTDPFETTGDYQFRFVAQIHKQTYEKKIACTVQLSAEQLWQAKEYEAALQQELRDEWLDILEKKAENSVKARYKYLQLLENLQNSVTDDNHKSRLAMRHTQAENLTPKTSFWQKGLVVIGIVGITLLGGVVFKILTSSISSPMENNQTSKKEHDTQNVIAPPPTLQESPHQSFEPTMVDIPAGTFTMGCVSGKNCRPNEETIEITLPAFQMASTEVTFAQWNACVKANVCTKRDNERWGTSKQADQHPVINVSWHDTQQYINWLKQETGKNYRLPTEAEWEYAARALSKTQYSWGNNKPSCNKAEKNGASHDGGKESNCYYKSKNRYRGTDPVASYKENKWGLYDMHGNVAEWTCSSYQLKYTDTNQSCSAINSDQRYVIRGGSWNTSSEYLRSATRYGKKPNYRHFYTGFRLIIVNN